MANLERKLQKIFANNSNQVGVFGTGVNKQASKDVEVLQSAAYENGWASAIVTSKNYPVYQEMDGVQYGITYQLKYLLQKGIPEWLDTETYYINDFCKFGKNIYYSLTNNNINNDPSFDRVNWKPLIENTIGEYPYTFNAGNVDSLGNPDLIDATLSQDTEHNTPNTYTFIVSTSGYYPIALVGGGGNGLSHVDMYGYPHDAYGGSGAAFVGEVYLNTGSHNITVGGAAGSSILYDENGIALITANGGNNAWWDLGGARNGSGGILTIESGVQTQNVTVQSNGGTGASGSKYQGYGQGGFADANTGRRNGYFSIQLPSGSVNINYKVGGTYPLLTGTLKTGEQFALDGINSDDITGLADGTYIKYVGSDGSSDFIKGKFTVSKTQPATPSTNDVWVNNSVNPIEVKQYDGSVWADYDKIPIGKVDIASGGINSVSTMPYNIDYIGSGLGYSMPSEKYIDLTLGASDTTYTAPANGWFVLLKIPSAAGQFLGLFDTVSGTGYAIWASAANHTARISVPCKKGNSVKANYTFAGNTQVFRFVYACDSEVEA